MTQPSPKASAPPGTKCGAIEPCTAMPARAPPPIAPFVRNTRTTLSPACMHTLCTPEPNAVQEQQFGPGKPLKPAPRRHGADDPVGSPVRDGQDVGHHFRGRCHHPRRRARRLVRRARKTGVARTRGLPVNRIDSATSQAALMAGHALSNRSKSDEDMSAKFSRA